MLVKRGAAVAASCIMLAFSTPAMAQTPLVDAAAIEAACSESAAACELAVAQAIAALKAAGLSPADLNAQLGVIAGTAIKAAETLPAAEKLKLGGMIREIAAASTNPAQKAALAQLASAVESGSSVDLVAFASAMSPN